MSKPISKFTLLEPRRVCSELSAGGHLATFPARSRSTLPGTSWFLVCSVLNFVKRNFFPSEVPIFITQTGILLLIVSNTW